MLQNFALAAAKKIEVVVAAVAASEFLISGINLSRPKYKNEASGLVFNRGLF